MAEPRVAGTQPMSVEVTPRRKYWWCACGLSEKQPFCDGSHKGSGLSPVMYESEEARTVWFCCCKQTGDRPLCDGTHNTLRAGGADGKAS